MNARNGDRRSLLKAAAALAVTGVSCAQTGSGTKSAVASTLPSRGEFVIRGKVRNSDRIENKYQRTTDAQQPARDNSGGQAA